MFRKPHTPLFTMFKIRHKVYHDQKISEIFLCYRFDKTNTKNLTTEIVKHSVQNLFHYNIYIQYF